MSQPAENKRPQASQQVRIFRSLSLAVGLIVLGRVLGFC